MLRRLTIVLVVLVLIGSFAVWYGKRALSEEDSLHLTIFTCEIVGKHFEKTGRWPRSWDELRDVGPMEYPGPTKWPDEMELLRRRVRIDFGLSTESLKSADPETFDGIAPIESSFPGYNGPRRQLIVACQERIQRDEDAMKKIEVGK